MNRTAAVDLTESQVRWVAGALAVAMLPHLLNLPFWVPAMTLAMIGWGWWIQHRGTGLPPRAIRLLLVAAATAGVLLQFHTLFGRDAGVSLLIIMLGLKLLELRSRRDALLALFLGYFVVAGHFFFTQSIPIAIYMIGTVWLMTAALTGLSGTAQPLPARTRLRSAGVMLAQSIPMMIVLFVLFPRLPGPIWALPKDSNSGLTGLGDEMSPGLISDLIQSNEPAFRVTFDGPAPAADARYWRGPVLVNFDGRTWRRSERPENLVRPPPTGTQPVSYTLTLQPSGKRWLLALDRPGGIPPAATLTPALEILATSPVRDVRQYRLTSYPDARLDIELDPWTRAQALRLPEGTAPQARELAREWRDRSPTPEAVVQRALDHYRQQPFYYTLQPPRLIDDPIDEFLFDTRRGFCEHYASSFTVLMRAAGIPARVVTGYLGGERSPLADYLLIRQSDAHAWAEVWLEGRGWVRIDPTAAVAPDRVERGVSAALGEDSTLPAFVRASYGASWLNRMSMSWDIVNYYWNDWVLAFGPERQRELLEKLGLHRLGWTAIGLILMGALGLLMALYAGLYWWRNRPRHASEVDALIAALEKRLAEHGYVRRPHESLSALGSRVAGDYPHCRTAVMPIVTLLQRARYRDADDLDHGSLSRAIKHLELEKRNPP